MGKNDSFIEKSRRIHSGKYDYSKVNYVNNKTKVCIICPEHGEFWKSPNNHISLKQGCPKCARNYNNERNELSKNNFKDIANAIHKNKYDYSKVNYVNNKTKVCIICPEHGEFWQRPDHHIGLKRGCPYCGGTKKFNNSEFIEKSKMLFGDKYDYSKVNYLNNKTAVCLIECETGIEFFQNPKSHLKGCSPIFTSHNRKLTTEEFIERSKKIHKTKYDYSKVVYNGGETEVCIICPEHGKFLQTPHTHLSGCGCPFCKTSKLENEIKMFLDKNCINYEYQKKFDWLKNKHKMSVDFYLPDRNAIIECQGRQHFREEKFFNGNGGYKGLVDRDKLKNKICLEHGIRVFYYSNYHHDYWDKVFYDKDELLKEINNS